MQSCLFEVTPSPPSVQRTVARTEAKTHEDAARRPADDVTDDDSADVGGGAPAGRPVASETRLTPAVGGGASPSPTKLTLPQKVAKIKTALELDDALVMGEAIAQANEMMGKEPDGPMPAQVEVLMRELKLS